MPPPSIRYDMETLAKLADHYERWSERTATRHSEAKAIALPSPDAFGHLPSSNRLSMAVAAATGRMLGNLEGSARKLHEQGQLIPSIGASIRRGDEQEAEQLRAAAASVDTTMPVRL